MVVAITIVVRRVVIVARPHLPSPSACDTSTARASSLRRPPFPPGHRRSCRRTVRLCLPASPATVPAPCRRYHPAPPDGPSSALLLSLAAKLADGPFPCWTKENIQRANYYGSLTQASAIRVGSFNGEEIYAPFKSLLPMVNPDDIVFGGWDIKSMNLADSMARARVLDIDLQKQLCPYMESMVPLLGIYDPDTIFQLGFY